MSVLKSIELPIYEDDLGPLGIDDWIRVLTWINSDDFPFHDYCYFFVRSFEMWIYSRLTQLGVSADVDRETEGADLTHPATELLTHLDSIKKFYAES